MNTLKNLADDDMEENQAFSDWLGSHEGQCAEFDPRKVNALQFAFEAGQRHAPTPTIAPDIARVVNAAIRWVEFSGECHFCDYSQYGHQGHDDNCVVGELTPESIAACEAAASEARHE